MYNRLVIRNIIDEIRQELVGKIDEEYKIGAKRYFKEEVEIMGIRTPDVRKIARMYYAVVIDLSKEELFELCEKLLKSKFFEEKTVGIDWIFRLRDKYKKSDFVRFKAWIVKYVDNWAHCDDFCTHIMGAFLNKYPSKIEIVVNRWSKAKNRWLRRASAVSLIYVIARGGEELKYAFQVSDLLMMDKDDLVQKGYGWLLKEVADRYPSEVYKYVVKNQDVMPRTALRYAIEKMPKEWRKPLLRGSEV